MVSTVASQQEGPRFESRFFLCGVARSPRSPAWVLPFPRTIKDMHVRVNNPVSGTDRRSGVGPQALS